MAETECFSQSRVFQPIKKPVRTLSIFTSMVGRHLFWKFVFYKKKVTQLFYPLYFFIIRYLKATCKKHHVHVNIQNMKNTQKRNKNNFQYFFLFLKYKCTIMCNYLNNYNNLNECSLCLVYIFMKNVQKKMYSLFVWYIFKTVQQ